MLNDFYLLLEEAVSVKVYEYNRCELQPVAFLKQFRKLLYVVRLTQQLIFIHKTQNTHEKRTTKETTTTYPTHLHC